MKKKDLWVYMVILIMAGIISSCQISDIELGEDLLPQGDNVILFHDTIFDIHSYPITSRPFITSERSVNADRTLLLGNLYDTIVGSSKASLLSQFNTNFSFASGANMEVDSVMLYLQLQDYEGDMGEEITIRVYELTERISLDSVYYSDYSAEGKYNPVPLVEKSMMPENGATLAFLIEDQDFRDKFLALGLDTSLFRNDSIFKDYFNGFYIEAESASPEGAMARVHLASSDTYLSLKYASDSTQVDSIPGVEFRWSQFTIDEYNCQKVSVFEHDFSGTHLSGIIDNESANSPYCYVQGMAGVNTKFSFEFIEEWMAKNPIAISSASLIFKVVPEAESGISYDDLPHRLMMGTILEDGSYESIYDYYVLLANSQSTRFGGYKKAESEGLFFDTTYIYQFNMGLHFQSMVDGAKLDKDFVLQLNDKNNNVQISKLWSNISANKSRIRLEVAYLKL